MVANATPEPSPAAGGEFAALLTRLDDMQRQLDETTRAAKFPFIVSHSGIQDFQIIKSPTGDGTADILMGNGAGGKLLQVITDPLYATKIYKLLDQQGRSMASTDALAGYGMGTPSFPFIYNGFESLNLAGATSQGTATEIGRGGNFVYNPATFINPRIRAVSSTNETIQIFVQWKDFQGNITNTANKSFNLTAGSPAVLINTFSFGKNWPAATMNGLCFAFIKAWCSTANPGNITATLSYSEGYGVSQRYYNDNAPTWAV